ncbi:hypothetical protein LOK49_LG03G03326 [Camellia lanceoleosa]|uniref:Uncharacterized protein n=1 Tax=Camellia lanceoleosa TaxID=1840588 RepID=A0ACC0IAZ0_9ERIC|nr:hypothetical protein LOK49_LG03G03326 [Camellia lanceoleosa]
MGRRIYHQPDLVSSRSPTAMATTMDGLFAFVADNKFEEFDSDLRPMEEEMREIEGAVPSTPRRSSATRPQDTEEYLIGTFVGEKSFPLASDFWQKLLELPLSLQWPPQRVSEACEVFG